MDPAEYTATQTKITAIAAVLRDLDLAGFLNAIQRSQTVAPIFDPSLYRRGAAKLDLMRQTANALYRAQCELPDVKQWIEAQEEQDAVESMMGIVPQRREGP